MIPNLVHSRSFAANLLFLLLLLRLPAAAQPDSPALRTALEAKWDAVQNDPLLAVDPAHVEPGYLHRMAMLTGVSSFTVPRMPGPDAPLRDIAEYYDRMLVPAGTLTALAPTEMVVLDFRPGDPDLLSGLSKEEKLRLLEAGLTPPQWQRLGSAEGLGVGDLNQDQQAVFLSLLPDPFRIGYLTRQNGTNVTSGNTAPTTLSPDQRLAVRLQLHKEPSVSFPSASRANSWVTFQNGRVDDGPAQLQFVIPGVGPREQVYGAAVSHREQNRLKGGQLRLDSRALDRTVSLAPDGASPLTVGALVHRIGEAAGLELYVDLRAADLPVWAAGTSARAGDVLKALCLALTGTFRKVGPAYLLTDDLTGIGARKCAFIDWWQDAEEQARRLQAEANLPFDFSIAKEAIGFAPDSTLPLPPDRMNAIVPNWGHGISGTDVELPIGDLSPEVQSRLRQDIVLLNREAERNVRLLSQMGQEHGLAPTARDDMVQIAVNVELRYLVPGLGALDDAINQHALGRGRGGPMPSFAAPEPAAEPENGRFRLPADAAVRALCLSAGSAEEAARVMEEAGRCGFSQLWLLVQSDAPDAVLAAAVRAGKEQGVAVLPVVRVMRVAGAPAEDRDINIMGETSHAYAARRSGAAAGAHYPGLAADLAVPGDWLRSDLPSVRLAVKQRLRRWAAAPGIAGLVLRDTGVPGYTDPGKESAYGVSGFPGWDFGYTLERRLACLRQLGLDAIDMPVPPNIQMSVLEPTFFPEYRIHAQYAPDERWNILRQSGPEPTAEEAWSAMRFAEGAALFKDLVQDLHAAQPGLPLYMDSRSPYHSMNWTWYVSAPADGELPALNGRSWFSKSLAEQVRSHYGSGLLCVEHAAWIESDPQSQYYGPPKDPLDGAAFAQYLHRQLGNLSSWNGLVLDLSDLPAGRALSLLSASVAGK